MKYVFRLLSLCTLAAAAHSARAAAYTLELRNTSHARENAVVSHVVTRAWADNADTHALFEITDKNPSPVPCGIDASGGKPVLYWLLPGTTAPNALRRFAWQQKEPPAPLTTDLRVTIDGKNIAVENSHFRLSHPLRGSGGFPGDITFLPSGNRDPHLFFLDRIVRPKADSAALAQYCARDCEDAETRIIHQSPLRLTVEARTGFGRKTADTPGRPQVRYRYTYTAFSPVVDVSASYTREDDGPWRELHFLHLTRQEMLYQRFVTGDHGKTHAMQAKGERSVAVTGAQWAVMEHGPDACGAGFDGAVCWDASNEFLYYVRSACPDWSGAEKILHGGLYFGPAKGSDWYSQWLGRARAPEITFLRDNKPWLPIEKEALVGEHEIRNSAMRLVFDAAANGFDCLGIENLLADNTRFVRTRPAAAGLWSLTFKTPPDADGRQEAVELTNRSQPRTRKAVTSRRGLTFEWQGLDLPGEAGAVDVRAEVRIAPGAGASEWRITVKNRSRRFGLWETDYPRLTGVVPPGLADVLLPRGNWGGSLMPRHAGQYDGRYPSFACPVQLAAFNLGEAGLYLAAHDGDANAKRLVVTREQDFTFKVLAENAGVPGAAGAPDYPLVIAAYKGDWWQAAKLYRTWALRQSWTSKGPIRERSDYPRRLTDLGFWMLLNGHPASVSDAMSKTGMLYPDMPLGVHWYNWHEIPFDHSYPEYFPAKPGVAEGARAMEAAGQTVMPYINARLWDRDIPSFTEAFAATCKQPSGTNYLETYGSGRYLSPMCPSTELWQQRIYDICASLMDEYNMGAIYLDQIGSAAPVFCFDPTHGHPTGGGSHWVDGYRTMMRSIKAAAVKRAVALTTEDSAEPYMDNIDACLAWNPRHQEDVPLLPAVYSGYTIYFTSPQSASDSLDAFCAAQARDFLWGCQLGWNDPWILQEQHREKQSFQYELCRYRLAAKEFMVFGELLDELRPEQAPDQAVHLWHRHQPHNARLPIVMGTLWRDAAGRLAAFVVNTSGHPQSFSFKVETARWSKCRALWRISLLTTEGEESLREGQSNSLIMGDLKPRETRCFVFTPDDAG